MYVCCYDDATSQFCERLHGVRLGPWAAIGWRCPTESAPICSLGPWMPRTRCCQPRSRHHLWTHPGTLSRQWSCCEAGSSASHVIVSLLWHVFTVRAARRRRSKHTVTPATPSPQARDWRIAAAASSQVHPVRAQLTLSLLLRDYVLPQLLPVFSPFPYQPLVSTLWSDDRDAGVLGWSYLLRRQRE